MRNKIIEIKNLCKSFGEKKILTNLNLDIYENESLVIIGESGSGKSILMKCLSGLHSFDTGKIVFKNAYDVKNLKKIEDLYEHTSKFGVLFQNAALFDSLSIKENIFFSSKISSKKILEEVGLKQNILEKYPADISIAMQKRVGLARAIISNPSIFIFDEPTTGLDPIMADQINRLIRELVDERKLTTITITHDMKSVYEFADKVAFIHNGKIEWYGESKNLKGSKNKAIQDFINGKFN